jgi:hypothetical protein
VISARTVTIVGSDKDTITIASGLNAGERVITSPLRGATDGGKVTPTETMAIPGARRDGDEEADTVEAAVREGGVQ